MRILATIQAVPVPSTISINVEMHSIQFSSIVVSSHNYYSYFALVSPAAAAMRFVAASDMTRARCLRAHSAVAHIGDEELAGTSWPHSATTTRNIK